MGLVMASQLYPNISQAIAQPATYHLAETAISGCLRRADRGIALHSME